MQLAALLVSLTSVSSIHSKARNNTHTFSQINKHTHTKHWGFFFFVVRTSVFFPKVRNESIPNCATLEGKSVCAWFKCCWSISARRRRRSKRACREMQEFFFSFSGTPLLKIRVRRTTAVFSYLFVLECKGFSYQIPSFPPVWDLCWVEYFVRSGPSFPRCGGTRYSTHTQKHTHTHKLTCRRFVPAFLWAAKREEEDARVKTNRS